MEGAVALLPESNTDIVETTRAGVESHKERDVLGKGIERLRPEPDHRLLLAYIKDVRNVPVLTSDEERPIARQIGDGESRLGDLIEDHAVPSPFAELVGVSFEEEVDRILSIPTLRKERSSGCGSG